MYTLEEMEKLVEETYGDLFEVTDSYLNASQNVIEFDRDLKVSINQAVANGEVFGKNQTERDAATQSLFGERFDKLNALKDNESSYRTDLDLVRIRVERVRALLRLLELAHQEK